MIFWAFLGGVALGWLAGLIYFGAVAADAVEDSIMWREFYLIEHPDAILPQVKYRNRVKLPGE